MEGMMNGRTKRIYVDTSVVGVVADDESRRLQTKPFWDAVQKGEIVIIASGVLDDELAGAPQQVRDFFDGLPESQIERVISTKESNDLAERYIAEGVVGESSLTDCRHIALATIAHADVLVSWNFKHIVNVDRIRGYNSVNEKLGYPRIEIRTPYEVIYDEN
jgi:hypothetical protein